MTADTAMGSGLDRVANVLYIPRKLSSGIYRGVVVSRLTSRTTCCCPADVTALVL